MKIVSKIILILFLSVCILVVLPQNISKASNSGSGQEDVTSIGSLVEGLSGNQSNALSASSKIAIIINKLLGFIQVAAGLLSVIVIAVTGFQYIMAATPDMKEEIKKKMFPMVIGIVCVFGASSIARFILGAVSG